MDKEKLGAFIRLLRMQRNMTQMELAEKVHVTDKAVSKWERGLSIPSIDLLVPLSNVLEVSVLELLDGQRQETDKIALERANVLLQETLKRQKRVIVRKRAVLLILSAFLFLCCMISGHLMWNQGLLLDERNLSSADIYYAWRDCVMDWLRYGLFMLLTGISLLSGLKKE